MPALAVSKEEQELLSKIKFFDCLYCIRDESYSTFVTTDLPYEQWCKTDRNVIGLRCNKDLFIATALLKQNHHVYSLQILHKSSVLYLNSEFAYFAEQLHVRQ